MPGADGFRINTPLVAIQEIEGEAILINFDTGCYYGANVTGSVLLELAQRGESVAAMVRALAGRCGVAESEVAGAADSFFKAAADGGLLVPLDASLVGSAPEAGASTPSGQRVDLDFVAPRLEKFDDLRDLLMLDPIHDVDQAGWPMPAPKPEQPI